MALHIFTKAMVEDREFEVFNYGDMSRDFTYVADIVESVKRLLPLPPKPNNPDFDPKNPNPAISSAPYQLFNIGNNSPVALMDYVHAIEKALGKKGKIVFTRRSSRATCPLLMPMCKVCSTIHGFKPSTSIEDGIKAFVDKYLELGL